jgi:drug/metabolite transporter (DMT)-like permease
MPARLIAAYAAIGVLVAVHWLAFYAAIKLADASVAATCLSVAPFFLALFEPLINRRRFDVRELALGIAIVPGVALVIGGTPVAMHSGIAVGVVAALLAAVFNVCNKRLAGRAEPLTVTHIEIGAGALFLGCVNGLAPHSGPLLPWPQPRDALLLVVLAVFCTLVPFSLALVALRRLSAFGAQLAVNLEPVYAIVLAVLLLGEQRELGLLFYLGVAIIFAAVFAQPLLDHRRVGVVQ